MDRISRVSGVDRSGGVEQVNRRQDGRSAVVLSNQDIGESCEEAFASGQQSGGQHPAQRHFTQQQARAYYFAQQQDKGQYYAEQQFGERYHTEHQAEGGASGKRKTTAEKNREFWKTYTEQQKKKEKTTGQNAQQSFHYNVKEYSETGNNILDQLKKQSEAFKKAMDPKNKKNLYDATMDLMMVEQAEKTAALKAIQVRLLFKMRSVKASGAKASEIRAAVSKIKKVIGKAKGKVKNLKKEEQLEKKRKKAEENRKKERERALRQELERRKKVRKAKERGDVEESKMGMGANYGGPADAAPAEIAAMAYGSTASAAPVEAGAAVDVAVADVGAVADAGAVDVSL